MLEPAVCIDTFFVDREFLDRVDATAQAGFTAFELWGWEGRDIAAMAERQRYHGLTVENINVTPVLYLLEDPDMALAAQAVRDTCRVAKQLGCPRITLHGDHVGWGPGRPWYVEMESVEGRERYLRRRDVMVQSIRALMPIAANEGLTMMLEPLNTVVDHRNYFLGSAEQALDVIRRVDHPALKLLFDIYHMQIAQGNVTDTSVHAIDHIGHLHVADVPGRHEPGTGELNFANILRAVRCAGYRGAVGLELYPLRDDLAALRACRATIDAALLDAA